MNNLILIVDDDVLTRIQLRELLEQAGYRVAEANHGQQALSLYSKSRPDLVLLDAIMPVMDGFTCCAQLRELPGGEHIPILIITGLADLTSVEQAFAVGATDFITKPIRWSVLLQRVHRLLEASQVMEKLRQQTQQAQNQEAQLRIALEAAQMSIWEWDILNNQITWLNKLPNESSLENFINRVHFQDQNFVREAIRCAIDDGGEYDIEFRLRLADNSIRWVASKGVVFRDLSGVAIRMSGVDIDITKRKQAEENLRQSEERFQILARATNDTIWDWDLQTNKVWWNDNVQTLFGYSKKQIQPKIIWWQEHIHPEDRQRIISDLNAVVESGEQIWFHEYRFRRADNSYAYIFDRGYIVHNNTGTPVRVIGAMMDISDRKRIQEELQRQNLRSQLFANITLKIRDSLKIDEILQTTVTEVQKLLRSDRVLVFQLHFDGSGTVLKEAVVSGFPAVLGRNIHDHCFSENYIHKYRQGRINSINDVEKAPIRDCHKEFLQQFAVKANLVVPIVMKNQLWGLLIAHQCANSRYWTNWETEILKQLADQIGIALAQAKLLEQETRQREELARSNEELQQFAFIASHDLQEPLRKIKAFGSRLKAVCEDALTSQGHDYLQRMENAANRMQALIDDLLALSRITTGGKPFIPVNLYSLTQEVLSDLELRIQQSGGSVELAELPTIDADPIQMQQLLQNLISNALKFHRPGELPLVKIYSKTNRNQNGIEVCQIFVEDNGIGFDTKYVDRIFNVFQRLHGRSEYEGTGIGLAICRKIVERHQGSITAESKIGAGAKFIVTLPMNSSS